MRDFHLTILGCGSALPARGRYPSSQYLKIGKARILIDCGEGTQHLLRKHKLKMQSITHICISHMHGDHFLGLMGLLFSMTLLGRKQAITIISPPEIEELINLHLRHAKGGLRYEVEYIYTQADKKRRLIDNDQFVMDTIPLDHRIATTGFVFKERPARLKMRGEKLEFHKVPIRDRAGIAQGADFVNESGETISNSVFTEAPISPSSYAYCSDTAYIPAIAESLKGVDVLFHESTFMQVDIDRAKRTHHSTAAQAAQVAQDSGVKRLLLGHYSARYDDLSGLLDEAKIVFPQSYLSEEGMQLDIHSV